MARKPPPKMLRSEVARVVRGIRHALDRGDCRTAYRGVAALLVHRAPIPGKAIARLQLATMRCQTQIRRRPPRLRLV